MQVSLTTHPAYNNKIKIIYDIIKALPFKKCVKSTDFKLCLKIFSDFDCFNINESEFQQSIDLQKKDDKTQLGRLNGLITIDEDAREDRDEEDLEGHRPAREAADEEDEQLQPGQHLLDDAA